MICFDKLKIVTDIRYIRIINNDKFIINYSNNNIISHKFKQVKPFLLSILINEKDGELVIEFTSKILKDNCISLININTIKECLSNINKMNICKLSINEIINNSTVVKCDPCRDIYFDKLDVIKNHIKNHISNYNKWIYKILKNSIELQNAVGTTKYKKRIIIYHKGSEILNSKNYEFLNSLKNKEFIKNYYNNRIRIELNINTMAQIRKFLKSKDNNLLNVLKSKANPIKDILEEVIAPRSEIIYKSLNVKDYMYRCVLKDCNFDLRLVEEKIRELSPKNSSIKRKMQPYIELLSKLNNFKEDDFDFIKLLE